MEEEREERPLGQIQLHGTGGDMDHATWAHYLNNTGVSIINSRNSGRVTSDRDIPMGNGIIDQIRQVEAAPSSYNALTEDHLRGFISELAGPTMHTIPSSRDLPPTAPRGDIYFATEEASTYRYTGSEYQLVERNGNTPSTVNQMRELQNELNVTHYRNQIAIVRDHRQYPLTPEQAFEKEEGNKNLYGTPEVPNFSPSEKASEWSFLDNINIVE